MNKFYFLIIFIFYNSPLVAQTDNGPRITAMGNAGVAMQDIWAAQKNQAGIANLDKVMIAIGYENRFSVKELGTQSAILVIPIKKIILGATFQSYGIDAYKEIKTGFSLAKSFGPKLLIGVNLNYHQLKIENYGNSKIFSVDVGLQYEAFPHLWLGTHISNPNQSKYGLNNEQIIPAHIQFGASYIFSKQLIVSSEVEKILDNQADFKTGLEYKVVKIMALRGGISVNPFKQFAGFGIYYEKFNIDLAVASHPVLGYSSQIAVGYEF